MNVSDVTITNKSLDGGSGRARWNYDVADAPVTSNGFKAKMHEAPLVSRNTITLHNCWYWTVKNPAAYSGQFRVKAVNRVFSNILGCEIRFQLFLVSLSERYAIYSEYLAESTQQNEEVTS